MVATLTTQQAKSMLLAIGFDNANGQLQTAVEGFQKGWNLGTELTVDGICGPLTSAALTTSYARQQQGLSTMSAHFSYVEFRCNDGRAFPECARIWEIRDHVRRLEVYRDRIGAPIRIVSGCRCVRHNAQVGGAKSSQHMFGGASDIQGLLTVPQQEQLDLFAGLGFKQSNNMVIHVDSRDKSGHNTTGGSPTAPTTWKYAS